MKKTLIILSFLLCCMINAISQVPDKFNYQATIRDNSGLLLISKDVKVKISILKSDMLGAVVYSETHAIQTTEQGIINLHIGAGTTSDDLSSINWNDGPYFLKTEIDPKGGNTFIHFGTSEILSVPFALSSKTAGSVEWDNVNNKPEGVTGSYTDLSDKPQIPENTSDLNNDTGFLTGFDETDPVFGNSPASSITSSLIDNWNLAYNWGNHANAGYAKYPSLTGNSGKYLITNGVLTYWEYAVNSANGPLYVNNNVVNIQKATSSTNGYLSSGDWNVFNNKISSQWGNNGYNIFYNNGNVGIGTNNPIVKLNIEGNYEDGQERALIRLKNLASGPRASVSIALQAYDDKGASLAYTSPNYELNDLAEFAVMTTNGRGIALAPNNGQIRFYTNRNFDGSYSEKMRIDENGNVGIGTITPSSLLSLVGNVESGTERNMFQLQNINESITSYAGIKLKTGFSAGHSVIQDYGMTYIASAYYDFAGFLNVANSNRGVMLHANSAEGVIKFYTGHDDIMGAGLERLRIDANGNVGIGTDIVKSKLQIADGDIYISDINKGIIMTSPDGQCWRGTISNTGNLEFVSILCP